MILQLEEKCKQRGGFFNCLFIGSIKNQCVVNIMESVFIYWHKKESSREVWKEDQQTLHHCEHKLKRAWCRGCFGGPQEPGRGRDYCGFTCRKNILNLLSKWTEENVLNVNFTGLISWSWNSLGFWSWPVFFLFTLGSLVCLGKLQLW